MKDKKCPACLGIIPGQIMLFTLPQTTEMHYDLQSRSYVCPECEYRISDEETLSNN
jgi:C4-type Zn-finger protein